jgi:hypothetical protein
MKGSVASLVPVESIGVGIVAAVVFFAWGWARAARFRSERGKPPWAIPPTVWGAIHVVLLPIGWLMYWAASRTTRVADFSLTHRSNTTIADTAEDREKLRRIHFELPLLRPPEQNSRGWHPDPLHQRGFRFFDGQRWTRDVTDDPARKAAEAVGDARADLRRRLRALPPPPDLAPSWHVDPLGKGHYRYFDGWAWTDKVHGARSS